MLHFSEVYKIHCREVNCTDLTKCYRGKKVRGNENAFRAY